MRVKDAEEVCVGGSEKKQISCTAVSRNLMSRMIMQVKN